MGGCCGVVLRGTLGSIRVSSASSGVRLGVVGGSFGKMMLLPGAAPLVVVLQKGLFVGASVDGQPKSTAMKL